MFRNMTGTIAEVLKQAKPFGSPEQEAMLGLLLVAARLNEPWAKVLKNTSNLTGSQYNVLRILRGSHPARLACRDIASRMIDRDPDVTRLLDRLEKQGLASRARSRTDRRVVETGITVKGLQLLGSLDPEAQRMPKVLLGHLGANRLRQLTRLLEAVITESGPDS